MRTTLFISAASILALVAGCTDAGGDEGRMASDQFEQVERADSALTAEATLPASQVGSKLMIAGGNIPDDSPIIDRLIAEVGGKRHVRMLVIAAANGAPYETFIDIRDAVAQRGVSKKRVTLAHIAAMDDETTPDVDESTWANGASEPEEVAKVKWANIVWLSGGDQLRLVNLMLDSAGNDTPVQAALRQRLAEGGIIITGSSAGAAVMSDPMIGGGTSFGALSNPLDPSCTSEEALCLARGLGYVPTQYNAVVDQHFTQRGRFARLVRALAAAERTNGWAVSENTGLLVDLNQGTAEVVGTEYEGFVTLVWREDAQQNHEQSGPPFLGDGYRISVLAVGDTYKLPTPDYPHGVASHPNENDYYPPFSQYYGQPPIFTDAFGKDVLPD
ncbi:MAG: cyanophycinase, partial [Myxococcales bacterium]